MNRVIVLATLAISLIAAQSIKAQDHFDRAQVFFEIYVSEDGLVDYAGLVKNPAALDQAVYDIAHSGMQGRSNEYKAAFYINAYNILTIKNVVDHWPLESPLDIDGFFDKITFTIASEKMTLNDLENIKLRDEFGDPRIHFALVCAGSGCPPLTKVAMEPGTLANRLKVLTETALNTRKMVIEDKKKGTVWISKIFEWFQVDFGDSQKDVITFINQYRSIPIPATFEVKYLEYDWAVNSQ